MTMSVGTECERMDSNVFLDDASGFERFCNDSDTVGYCTRTVIGCTVSVQSRQEINLSLTNVLETVIISDTKDFFKCIGIHRHYGMSFDALDP
ncbi:hypothetical protein Y032_0049g1735 [Ancylostoma ceylanicum]|uniref:Uncharacterized protein n=1 Tax=Ancylostoma ceylanicum TaxID=53326 RepID=A0A016UAU5_9BILA|nr:hypothetical protein Y032_0049g1735 [Ancylostoma ceylanicum]